MNTRIDLLTSIAADAQARILGHSRVTQSLRRANISGVRAVEVRPESARWTRASELRPSLSRSRP